MPHSPATDPEPDHLTTRPPLGAPGHRLDLIYTNHRGETRRREVIPVAIYWGESKHHPHKQWLLECWDIEKRAERTYALKDCNFAGARDELPAADLQIDVYRVAIPPSSPLAEVRVHVTHRPTGRAAAATARTELSARRAALADLAALLRAAKTG